MHYKLNETGLKKCEEICVQQKMPSFKAVETMCTVFEIRFRAILGSDEYSLSETSYLKGSLKLENFKCLILGKRYIFQHDHRGQAQAFSLLSLYCKFETPVTRGGLWKAINIYLCGVIRTFLGS